MSISFLFVLSCILSYALPLHPVFGLPQKSEVIDNVSSKFPVLSPFLIRMAVVLFTMLVAFLVPKFALVVSFTGSIITSFCTYIFPCAVHHQIKVSAAEK